MYLRSEGMRTLWLNRDKTSSSIALMLVFLLARHWGTSLISWYVYIWLCPDFHIHPSIASGWKYFQHCVLWINQSFSSHRKYMCRTISWTGLVLNSPSLLVVTVAHGFVYIIQSIIEISLYNERFVSTLQQVVGSINYITQLGWAK